MGGYDERRVGRQSSILRCCGTIRGMDGSAATRLLIPAPLNYAGYLLVLIALGVAFVLPALDHHAAERIPGHIHLIPGGGIIRHAHYLGHHRHSYERPHTHHLEHEALPAHTHNTDLQDPHSPIISALDTYGIGAFGLTYDLVLPNWSPPYPLQRSGDTPGNADLLNPGVTPSTPDPPPRYSFSSNDWK
ncbi:MAG: hypothetical protein KatS3mg057_1203 [Herpetosiphonaceae bacterium]|nr:MAG: hypothetical protein KatS3mg057_1203 [Herpetosiphonaceae bacterium]